MHIHKIFRNEDSLDDFDNRRRVRPDSKYITFSGVAKNAARDGVAKVLNKKNVLNPWIGSPGSQDFWFGFNVRNKEKDVLDVLAALNALGERNTWFIQYNDGDSVVNRISDFSPDIPNDLWYSGDMNKIVNFIMPKKGKTEASVGADETIEYKKGHKNSRGEDAPWVIRDHKNGKVLASFPKKDDAEAHLERMKHYSKGEKLFNKQELESMAMNGYKAAVTAAWSGAGVKNFKIDARINEEEPPTLDVIPKTLDGKGIDVSWRLLPNVMKIAQYSISPAGNHTIEREMDFATEDYVEKIFTDEFKSLDDVLEHGKPSESANEDAYMDALDAELDEIIAAGAAPQQAAAADAKLQEEPIPEFTDTEYMDVMKAINRLGRARVRAISQKAGLPLTKTGRILKELVASGYAFGRKQGASNVFTLTPEGEAEVPPPELNSKVPERVKKLILSPAYSSASMEDRVDFINKMYDDVAKAGIGDIHWNSAGSGDWQWAYVKPSKREYYLITITPDGTFGTVTFNNPDKNGSVGETATCHDDWSIAEFQKYLDERIPAIQAAYAKVKDYESKYYYYSFYSSKNNKNVKNKEEMLAVVEGTKGTGMTYYFRYGFAWKGAGKSKVSYEKFREYCNQAQVDIEVNYNTMEAEVNEFSENDMY